MLPVLVLQLQFEFIRDCRVPFTTVNVVQTSCKSILFPVGRKILEKESIDHQPYTSGDNVIRGSLDHLLPDSSERRLPRLSRFHSNS